MIKPNILLSRLLEDTAPLREQLGNHPLYGSIRTMEDIQTFMETHVFAVWDFMSLLKSLQRGLTCVNIPWVPTRSAATRLVNAIVLDEESDLDLDGHPTSHFDLYCSAMEECGASTRPIERFLKFIENGYSITTALNEAGATPAAAEFVKNTFRVIATGGLHEQAAAFAFGREDVIPLMFLAIIDKMNRDVPDLDRFRHYLRRHIELDGDDHGPQAHQMVADLCMDDPQLWTEATVAAREALRARIALWDSLLTNELRPSGAAAMSAY